MGRVLRGLLVAALFAGVLALILIAPQYLERVVDRLVRRIGAGPGLAVVLGATVLLGALWLRFGGTRVLRRWGVVLTPARPDEQDRARGLAGDD